MTNKDLQKELKEKIKEGIKPSDLKKKKVKPKAEEDEGYESEKENIIVPTVPTPPPLPNQQIKNLQTKITALERQLQTYKDFKEADLKIKEKYKQEIAECKKTIEELKSQAKPTEENPIEVKTFLCSSCQQTKPTLELSRAFNNFSFCLECSKKARKQAQQEKSESKEFTCHSCQQIKTELPNKMKLDSTLTEYLVCQQCRPTLEEFNEADLITDDL